MCTNQNFFTWQNFLHGQYQACDQDDAGQDDDDQDDAGQGFADQDDAGQDDDANESSPVDVIPVTFLPRLLVKLKKKLKKKHN